MKKSARSGQTPLTQQHRHSTRAWKFTILLIGGLAVLIWGALFFGGMRGFDLSDNGFYLLSISQYENITIDSRWFAGLLAYPYKLFGESVVALRLFGMLVTLIVTGTLAFISISLFQPIINRSQHWLFILPALSAGVFVYRNWSTTPSYNWLVLIGVSLVCIGVLNWLAASNVGRARWGAFILGIGVMLVAWGKLTSMGVLLVWLLVALPITAHRFQTWRRLRFDWWLFPLLGGVLILLLGVGQEISLDNWVGKLQRAFEHQSMLRDDTSLFLTRFIVTPLLSLTRLLVSAMMTLVPFGLLTLLVLRRRQRLHTRTGYLLLIFVYLLNLAWVTGFANNSSNVGRWALALYIMTLLWVFIVHRYANDKPSQALNSVDMYRWLFSLGLVVLPIVVSFGTRNYAAGFGTSAYFVVLASLLIIASSTISRVLKWLMLVGITLSVAWVMFTTAQNPYRQDVPVWKMQTPVTIRQGQDSVLVSEKLAIYLRDIQTVAEEAGFVAGTPIIDWTGHAPGTVYALGGEAYGFMWFLGNYAGSDEAARFILEEGWTESQRQSAWLLTSDGRRALSDDVLRDMGIDFSGNYEAVGQATLPFFNETHTLWRPINSP
jgi:hypothetical protein